jgi:hypothetical protein
VQRSLTPGRTAPARAARREGEEVARSRGVGWLGRSGFAARGLLYGVVGAIAIEIAVGGRGRPAGQQGAMGALAQQPLGKVLLALVAVGLAGFALWRLAHAVVGRGPDESDTALERLAALGGCAVYAGLCAVAVEALFGSQAGGSGETQRTTGGVLGWPGRTWLVGAAGVALVGVGLFQTYRGVSRDFLEESKVEEMSDPARTAFAWTGAFGYLARAAVFGLVGVFLVKAALEFDPNRAVGVDGALAKLAREPYGPALVGLVAAGLIAFGLYSLADARYRRL